MTLTTFRASGCYVSYTHLTGRYIGMDGVYSSKYFDYYADCIRAIPCADMDFNFADYCAVYHPSNGNAERFVNCMIENSEKQK